jgi:SAM-dependent methyltransferase
MDHFSQIAARYAAHRPTYPAAAVDLLAELAPGRDLAWDSGCGSGQLSVLLAERFARVIATDASAEQIAMGRTHPLVEYRRAPAEASGLPDAVVDLAVSAQAAHWFDLPGYYAEVRRVARPCAIVALLTYGRIRVDADVDPFIERFYGGVLGRYWPPERRSVEDGYRSLAFPFEEIPVPPLEMGERWALGALLGYVDTWSATWALERAEGRGPIEAFQREIARVWGVAAAVRPVHWDLTLRVGRL